MGGVEDVLKSKEEQEKSQKLPTSAHPRPRGIVGDRAAEGVALIRHDTDQMNKKDFKVRNFSVVHTFSPQNTVLCYSPLSMGHLYGSLANLHFLS